MRISDWSSDVCSSDLLRDLNKPVIAAVSGMAVGGGFELALSADLIIAAEHATFALPEISAGTIPDAATVKLPKRMPYHVAMDLLLTGRWLAAQAAHRCALVTKYLPQNTRMARAYALDVLLGSGPPAVLPPIQEVSR